VSQQRADETREEPPVVIRDRRRIDPRTGAVRTPDSADGGAGGAAGAAGGAGRERGGEVRSDAATVTDFGAAELQAQLDERTADLQRVTAEYANYRKRVDRDRAAVEAYAKAQVVLDLLPVLDDLERAEAHGDLNGPFKSVADKLSDALQKSGLEAYGHEGEEFDPALHEAVQHSTSPDVDGPTVTAVLRRGYKFGERVLRPAMVAVTDHEPAAEAVEVAELAGEPLIEPEPPGAVARPEATSSDGSSSNGSSSDGGNDASSARQ
jgi:molecular chaperone GrpE